MAGAVSRKWPGGSYRQNDRLHAVQHGIGESEVTVRSCKVITAPDLDSCRVLTTDGEIAVINLESARRRSWNRFFEDPLRNGVTETIVGHEQLTSQFVGDLSALDRQRRPAPR
jgi:hypothetical protein